VAAVDCEAEPPPQAPFIVVHHVNLLTASCQFLLAYNPLSIFAPTFSSKFVVLSILSEAAQDGMAVSRSIAWPTHVHCSCPREIHILKRKKYTLGNHCPAPWQAQYIIAQQDTYQ
jgi:hypothetical protein